MRALKERLADVPMLGTVTWIGVRPAHGEPMIALPQVRAIASRGLEGDAASRGRVGGKRQVTLVQAEHLPVLAGFLRAREIAPEQLRRNLVIAGINLVSLTRLRFSIGDEVILEGTGSCAPCGKLDETLGPGGFQAARGHGGLTASIERGGVIRLGDSVRVLPALSEPPSAL